MNSSRASIVTAQAYTRDRFSRTLRATRLWNIPQRTKGAEIRLENSMFDS
jgi:hypothetical protein